MADDLVKVAIIENELQHIKEKISTLTNTIDSLEITVSSINNTLSQARGSWQALITVGTICAFIGAAFSWIFDHFAGK